MVMRAISHRSNTDHQSKLVLDHRYIPLCRRCRGPEPYAPQPYQQAYRADGHPAQPTTQQYEPREQWAQSPYQNGLDRQRSLRSPATSQPALHRQTSMTYGPIPQTAESRGYSVEPLLNTQQAYASASLLAQDAPPIDMASHPKSSPTTSVHSALPIQSQYASPLPIAPTILPTSPPQQQQPTHPTAWQQAPAQSSYPYQQQQYPSYNQHQPVQQPVQQPQNVYNTQSFPQAPTQVFPDAPMDAPHGIEQQEQDEPLLIEAVNTLVRVNG